MIVSFSMQTYFSLQHCKSAAYFARQAKEIELKNELNYDKITILKAYVTACIFSSVAFLEAAINELFATDSSSSIWDGLTNDERKNLASAWDEATDKKPTLEKFAYALELLERIPFNKGHRPYSDTNTLISIRNKLVHYNGSWFDIGTEGMLRDGALATSKLANETKKLPKIPDYYGNAPWLSSGTAEWAITSALTFADEFYKLLKITPVHDHIREELQLN